MAPTIRVRNADRLRANTPRSLSFCTGEYLLYWDRKRNAAVVATGPFKGRVWTTSREAFFNRKLRYVGILDGRRIKRVNYLTRADYLKIMGNGLRKVYMSTMEDMPREFRGLSQGTSS